MKKSKKIVLKPHTLAYNILKTVSGGDSLYGIRKTFGITKQRACYWLKKFKEEELVYQPFHGFYEATIKGQELLERLGKELDKDLVRLENMRYKFPIHGGLENFIKSMPWKKIQELNNVKVYHTKYEDHSVRVFAGKEHPCLEITCIHRMGTDIYEMMYEARQWVEYIAKKFQDEKGLKLGMAEPSMQPEWAIPSPFAQVLLQKTSSSQIRTPQGIINSSKGRNPDLEIRDVRLANKIFNLPYVIDDIKEELTKLKSGQIIPGNFPLFL